MSAIDKVLAFVAPNTAKRIEAHTRKESRQIDLERYLLGGEQPSWTEIDTDRLSIMGLPVLWACLKVLSESMASFPLILYDGTPEGETRKRAVDHPYYDLLHSMPNPQQDSFCFVEQLQGHLGLYGNAYASIIRKGSGYITELWPMNPDSTQPFRKNGELLYRYQNDGREVILSESEIFHIHGFGFDGIRGYCPLELQSETYGLAIAAKHYAADFFANNGTPDIAFSHSQHLTDQALKRLQESWRQNHSRWGQKHKPIILEEGMEVKQLNLDPDKVQLISVQKFLVIEICRVYRIPPHMVQDLERATFSNIEHQSIEFVQHTMRPWAMRWESAISRQLLSKQDRKRYYAEFYMDALLRGDAQTRATVYSSRIGSGQMSPNEARRREQENDRDGGDTYYVPLNWVDASAPPAPPKNTAKDIVQSDAPGENSLKTGETRSIRSAKSRRAIANSFGILLKDAAARIVRKECHDLRKAVSDQLKTRDSNSFALWLEKYYRELPDYISKQITPVYQAFSNAIRAEIGNELGIDETVKPEDEQFVRQYVDVFIKRYVNSSTGQLNALIRDSSAQDMADVLDERLNGWDDMRAGQVEMDEKTQASNAFAKNIYRLAGILTLTWISMSGKPCDYCASMDGTSVNINDDFAYNGETLPDDERSMGINKNIGHPPLHRGCECQIMAGG
jgi:HK97 family phage portal protein